ncbi:MAG: adenosylmethionine decarboxylase [Acidimicrobiales bacterium]
MSDNKIGSEMLCDVWTSAPIARIGDVLGVLSDAVAAGGATLLDMLVKQFEPEGVSVVAIIGESHVAIHTWPELKFLSVEAFTCSSNVDLDAMRRVIVAAFDPIRIDTRLLDRGADGPPGVPINRFSEREPGSPGVRSYEVSRMIERRRSEFQDIVVFESPGLGRVLAIDNIVQVADVDAYVYHELLVHPAMCNHPNPRNVAIVGGGDGYAVAEVLKHDVEQVTVLDLDEAVVDLSRLAFPAAAAFDDPRVTLRFGDAYETLPGLGPVDVILCDMTDPIGQAGRFFEDGFLERAAAALGDDGVLAQQSESVHFHPATVRRMRALAPKHFTYSATVGGPMATYPGAWWTFTVAGNGRDPRVAARQPALDTRLYDPASHDWFFVPDRVLDRVLARSQAQLPAS